MRVQSLEEEDIEERTDEAEAERRDPSNGNEPQHAIRVSYRGEDVPQTRCPALDRAITSAQHQRGDQRQRPDRDADEDRRAIERHFVRERRCEERHEAAEETADHRGGRAKSVRYGEEVHPLALL